MDVLLELLIKLLSLTVINDIFNWFIIRYVNFSSIHSGICLR